MSANTEVSVSTLDLTAGSHGSPSVITPLPYSRMCYSSRKQGNLKVLSIHICYGWIVTTAPTNSEKICTLADKQFGGQTLRPCIHGWWQWATSVFTTLSYSWMCYFLPKARQSRRVEFPYLLRLKCYYFTDILRHPNLHLAHFLRERKRERSTCYCCRRVSTSSLTFHCQKHRPASSGDL